ncbi:MAG TPA: hypothetical protein VFS44_00185 [Gemmatimonadaceae bacterium]|nr:hypothetical protein [Gemmatimonadaceae bacterium]
MPVAGDILLEGLESASGTGHTAMCLSNSTIVHATPGDGAVVVDDLDMLSGTVQVYSCRNPHVAAEAARLAEAWARPQIRTPFSDSTKMKSASGYSEGRALGISEANRNPELRTFDFDALYRAFKWASNKGEKPFSKQRGTTCCPFVTACYQAAWIRYHFANNDGAIAEVFDQLLSVRPAKAPKEERVDVLHVTTSSGTKLGRRPFPQFASVEGPIKEEVWTLIAKTAKRLSNHDLTTPADLVTSALLVDAKFNSTRNLQSRLQGDGAHWSRQGDVTV